MSFIPSHSFCPILPLLYCILSLWSVLLSLWHYFSSIHHYLLPFHLPKLTRDGYEFETSFHFSRKHTVYLKSLSIITVLYPLNYFYLFTLTVIAIANSFDLFTFWVLASADSFRGFDAIYLNLPASRECFHYMCRAPHIGKQVGVYSIPGTLVTTRPIITYSLLRALNLTLHTA